MHECEPYEVVLVHYLLVSAISKQLTDSPRDVLVDNKYV